jgi:hypothetical protein
MREFEIFLRELFSGQPQPKDAEGLSQLVLFLESIVQFFVYTINCSIVDHLIHERIIVSRNPF